MNTQLDAILSLIQLNRKALRELAEVADTTSADFVHIFKAQDMLNEQFHILLQQKEETEAMVALQKAQADTPQMEDISSPADPTNKKRGRGAIKQYYLKDLEYKPIFEAHIHRIFTNHYIQGKAFTLPNKTSVKAHLFLACLYDLGIKLGITSSEAPVKDFCDMMAEIAETCSKATDFNTAYNTVQKATKRWNPFTGKDESQLYCTMVRLHEITPSVVPTAHKKDYEEWMILYAQVEEIYHATK